MYQVCPPPLFEELFTRFLSGQLHELCLHPNANFVVQAAIAATTIQSVVREGGGTGLGAVLVSRFFLPHLSIFSVVELTAGPSCLINLLPACLPPTLV